VGGCLSSVSQTDLRMVILWVAVPAEALVPSHRSHLETERKPTQDKAMKASSRSLKTTTPVSLYRMVKVASPDGRSRPARLCVFASHNIQLSLGKLKPPHSGQQLLCQRHSKTQK